ncbi:MAG: hypothetical protein AB1589_45580, partial [Cyanobacteriota bacterium]
DGLQILVSHSAIITPMSTVLIDHFQSNPETGAPDRDRSKSDIAFAYPALPRAKLVPSSLAMHPYH